ncbi:MAG: SpoIIE family protein phosphatase [Leptospiraceae bacterium]|nr:SpoIIE family protein phosphatase [Leptospiraceae bacterium]
MESPAAAKKESNSNPGPVAVLVAHPRKKSLRLVIGLIYTVLAVVNIIFFSVMIFENQTDLLMNTFKYQSTNLVNEVLNNLEGLKLAPVENDASKLLQNRLRSYDLKYYQVFTKSGQIWFKYASPGNQAPEQVDEKVLRKITELSAEQAMFRSRYSMELNEADYSIDLVIPLQSATETPVFLFAPLNISSMQDRLRDMYKQILISVSWGVIFHILFALFLFRVIFKRITILKDTTDQMSGGDLQARAVWRQGKRDDELDDLGLAFNTMADNLAQKIETISQLNQEIQQELSIGKDVQELFLGNPAIYEDYQLSIFYRPLREVSGDVYKFYELRNGLRALFFADASGHGVSAALITTITLLSLDEILRTTVKPGAVLSRLNDMLAERLDTSYFATGVFFLMDRQNNVFFANAGHNPVLCVRPETNDLIELNKMGPPMGLMEDFEYGTKRLSIKSGDKLFIYSDGLVETPNVEDEQYGLDRVKELVMAAADQKTGELCERIQVSFTEFANHYKDDVTLMVLEIP